MTARRSELLEGLERELGVLVRRARRVIGERAKMVHHELTGSSYLMLVYVAEQGPMRASMIAEQFDLDKGAISRAVTTLTDLGLLDRVPDPDDRRAALVSVSPEAARRLKTVGKSRRTGLDARLHEWDDDSLRDLVAMLTSYNAALET